ncbi:hypothetical protein [Persicobacter sp. CCB-QB2]|uniref:hypothetical protein n=1 Tax=Persicobacter sp. CCB-QB2 TaxID=1561025 RepID=UPI0006A9D50A|nr:hypothetical protein [Persicobacter sp. CCB-QB2]
MMKKLLIFFSVFMITNFAHAQYEPASKWLLGVHLGSGFTYSNGVELGYLATEDFQLNAGIGTGLAGGKFGLGMRYFLLSGRYVQPILGAQFYRNNGFSDLEVTYNDGYDATYGYYDIHANNTLVLNTGIKIRTNSRFSVMIELGHGIAFDNQRYTMTSGEGNSSTNALAGFIAPGGFSFDVGFMLNLGS